MAEEGMDFVLGRGVSFHWEGAMWAGFWCKSRSYWGVRARREGAMAKRFTGMLLRKKYLHLKMSKCGYFLTKERPRQRYILFTSLAQSSEIHNNIYLFRKRFILVGSLGFSCSWPVGPVARKLIYNASLWSSKPPTSWPGSCREEQGSSQASFEDTFPMS